MRMKKQLFIAMALLSLGVTSCKDDVTFDQDTYDNLIKEAFPVKNVDPTHQWTTVGVANTSIAVNTGTGDTYQVKIYDENPIGYKGILKLYGEGRVADGNTLDMKISYPLAQAWAYVTLFDSQNYMSVYPTLIQDGLLQVNINNTQTKKAPHRVGSSHTFANGPKDSDFKTSVPSDALPFNAYNDATKNSVHNYVNEDRSGVQNVNFWQGNFNLYIKGTAELQFNQPGNGSDNMNFYVLPGAKLTFKYNNFSMREPNNFNMYIAEGATVTFEAGSSSSIKMYNRGSVIIKGSNASGVYGKGLIYNEGTMTFEGTGSDYVGSIPPYGAQVSSALVIANSESEFVNVGTLISKGLRVEGSGHFMNLGTVTINGYTVVNSNDCSWVNDGTYNTDYFFYQAGSTNVINNCKLIVDENFYIGLGETDKNSFQLNGSASVITKTFDFVGPGFIKMGSNSLFKVTETANMAITKDGYGIYGPSTGNDAIFMAKKIARRNGVSENQGFVANYFGHLYVVTDDHFNFGYSDKSAEQQAAGEVGAQPYFRLDAASGAKMTSYNGANVTLSDEGCGAAYVGTPDEEEREEVPQSYRYCFEDNFPDAGDYDFNDVVLTVTPTLNDKTLTIQVSLDAVGALKTVGACIRLLTVKSSDLESYTVTKGFASPEGQGLGDYKNIDTGETFVPDNQSPNNTSNMVIVLFKDAHWAINPVKASDGGVQRLYYNTIIRGSGDHNNAYVDPATATYTLVFKDADKAREMLAENLYDVFIVEPYGSAYWEVHTVQNDFKTAQVITPVKPNNDAYIKAYGNNMPWAIMVPGDFKYPYEWQVIGKRENGEITGAYKEAGHSFAEWAENSNNATDWYKYPTSGLVYE
jgi:LruC domain-containing protein